MPWHAFTSLIDSAAQGALVRPGVHFTGGEPLLHLRLVDLLAYTERKGLRWSMTTNGTFLLHYANEIMRHRASDIRVSLDGPEEVHNAIRGTTWAYERAVQGIEALTRARSRDSRHPRVSINCTMSSANLAHLKDMIDIASDLGIDGLNFQHLMFEDKDRHGIDADYLIDVLADLRSLAQTRHFRLSVYPKLNKAQIANYYGRPNDLCGDSCVVPWFVARVLPDGSVSPCRGVVVGRATDDSFSASSIWNSSTMRAYRRHIVSHGLYEDCGRCCHRLYRNITDEAQH